MTSPLPTATGEITGLLRQASNGDTEALAQVTPLVYGELHRLAHSRLAREGRGHTLETGALVHETWLRMVDQRRVTWQDRGHFFAVAAEAMRRILVDHAREKRAAKET